MKYIFLLLILCPLALGLEDQLCDGIEGFWAGFNGSSCASDAKDFCENSFSIYSHIYYAIKGDWYELFEIFTDLTEMGWEMWDMVDDCAIFAMIKEFFLNFITIVKQWPGEIWHNINSVGSLLTYIGEGNWYLAGKMVGTATKAMMADI